MTETRSNSQKSEKIAAFSKVTNSHEQTLQGIQKQLQSLTTFMQKWVKFEEKRQQSPSPRGYLVNTTSNTTAQEPLLINPIKNLKLEFPRFQGEDPTYWVYRENQFFSYHNTPEHQKVIMASYHLDGDALIWF